MRSGGTGGVVLLLRLCDSSQH